VTWSLVAGCSQCAQSSHSQFVVSAKDSGLPSKISMVKGIRGPRAASLGWVLPSRTDSGAIVQRVYIETTFVSYLTARPSRDLIVAGHQQITHDWWDNRRGDYDLCVSQLVIQEAGDGDAQAAQERLAVLATMTLLDIKEEAVSLAEALVQAGALPAKAENDALHIAVAAVHRVPYLLTWNCRHMANATMRAQIENVCASKGLKAPIICTPEEMMETKP